MIKAIELHKCSDERLLEFLTIGTRLRAKVRLSNATRPTPMRQKVQPFLAYVGDATIVALREGASRYVIRTYVWQNEMNMTAGEVREFFTEAVKGERDEQEPVIKPAAG